MKLRKSPRPALVALLSFVSFAFTACKTEAPALPPPPAPPPPPPAVTVDDQVLGSFAQLPTAFANEANPESQEKLALGRALYFEQRLSKNHDVACASCHPLDSYGVDGRMFSEGHKKQLGGRNAPTVYNAGGHVAQFWDGRAADLEAQAKGPILNPVEMAMPNDKKVIAVLKSIPGYVEAFAKAFPGDKDPVTYDNLGKAIGAFERRLVTPSRFDKFLGGDKSALTDTEKRGLNEFAKLGCTTCHNGPAVGGASYQKLGLVKAYETKDLGRFAITKDEADRAKFRVPSLRNIEKTAPYMHDGGMAKLEEMVRFMADHQLGKDLTDEQVTQIMAFLKALTGDLPTQYIAQPELPLSGPKTPKPDPT